MLKETMRVAFLVLLLLGSSLVEGSKRTQEILKRLSLKEKVGQMTQLEITMILKEGSKTEVDEGKLALTLETFGVGSLLNSPFSGQDQRGGLSTEQWQRILTQIQDFALHNTTHKVPIIFGLDSVHGAGYINGATLFPQNLGLASTFNLGLARVSGFVTAKETRRAGVHWVFGPDVENFLSPLWPRAYETFGEDPLVCALFGQEVTEGMQGLSLSSETSAAACLKHYVGYGIPRSGKDRTDAWIPEPYLRQYFLPPFQKGIESNAATIMANSGSINGVPVHASKELLTDVLRGELGFKGVLVTDWEDIKKLVGYHRLAKNEREATKMSVLAGIDMSMVPFGYSFNELLLDLVMSGEISEERLDESVERVLELKEQLGLFENPYPTSSNIKKDNKNDREAALESARESVILAKNQGSVLPLSSLPSGSKILVTGPTGNSLTHLCGGWTVHWQGMIDDQEAFYGSTIFEGLTAAAPNMKVVYKPGCSFDECNEGELDEALNEARSSDIVVLTVGESPYTESPGNINDLLLGAGQIRLYERLKGLGKKIVLVVIEGRPRLLGPLQEADAILMSFLPCLEGGQALGEVLMGLVNPSGRFPFSYPRNGGDLDVYYHKPWGTYSQGTEDPFHEPLFPFGHGLSYTRFTYSNLYLSSYSAPLGSNIDVFVTCTNTGGTGGKEATLLYLKQEYRSKITPEDRLLKGFQKFPLQPNQQTTLKFTLTPEDMSYYLQGPSLVLEPGEFTVFVGGLNVTFALF